MPVLTVSEILQREVGEQIPAARGTLKSVFKRSEGTNEYGKWSIQNAELTDGKSTLKLKLMNKEDVGVWRGKEVYLLALHDKKGFSGLLYKQDSYTSKKTGQQVTDLVLEVQDKGSITLNQPPTEKPAQAPPPNVPCDSGGVPIDPDEGEPERPPAPPAKSKPVLTPQEKWDIQQKAVHEASADMTQVLNLYLLACEGVLNYAAPAYQARYGVTMSPEQKEKLIMSVYIDTRPRLAGTMPTGAIEPFLKPKGGAQ